MSRFQRNSHLSRWRRCILAANSEAFVRPATAILIVSFLCAGCAPKRVQVTPRAPDWGTVENLNPGQLVEIESRQGVQTIGKVSRATASELHVAGESGRTIVARREDIRQVAVIFEGKSDSIRNGALIGALIGAGYASGVLIYLAGGDDSQGGGRAAASVVVGAAIGAGIGALIDKARSRQVKQVIYRVGEQERSSSRNTR